MNLLVWLVAAVPSTQDVISSVEANYQRFLGLPGLSVSYTITYKHVRGKRLYDDIVMDVENVRAGAMIFVSIRIPERERKSAWNGTVATESIRSTRSNSATTSVTIAAVPLGDVYGYQYYVDALFYPEGQAKTEDPEGVVYVPGKTGGLDYWLPDGLIRNAQRYRVLPNTQAYEGAQCVVLEWLGRDRIWLDPELAYAIRRRDFYERDGKMRDRLYFREFDRVDDLWLPRSIVHEHYCTRDDAPALRNQISGVRTIRVDDLRAEPVPDSQFVLEIPDGAYVRDMVRHMRYDSVAPGDDPVARAEAQVIRQLRGHRSVWTYLLWLASAIVVIAAGVMTYRRWLRSA